MSTVRRVRSSSHLPSASASLKKTPTRVASSGYIKNSHIRSGSGGSHESAAPAPAPSADCASLVRKFSTLVLRHTHDELTDTAPANSEPANGYLPAIVLGPHGAFQRLVYVPRTEAPGVRVLCHANASDVGVPPPPPVVPSLLTQPLPQLPQTTPAAEPAPEPPSACASAPPLRAEEKVPHSPSLDSAVRQARDDESLRTMLREWQGAFGAFVPRNPAEYMDAPRSASPPRPRQLGESVHRSPRMAPVNVPLTPLENTSTQARGESSSQHNAEDKWSPRHITAAIRAFFRDGPSKQDHYLSSRGADARPPSSDTVYSNQSGESCTAGTSVPSPYELSPDPSLLDVKSTCNSTTSLPGRQRTKRSFRDLGRRLGLHGSQQQ